MEWRGERLCSQWLPWSSRITARILVPANTGSGWEVPTRGMVRKPFFWGAFSKTIITTKAAYEK